MFEQLFLELAFLISLISTSCTSICKNNDFIPIKRRKGEKVRGEELFLFILPVKTSSAALFYLRFIAENNTGRLQIGQFDDYLNCLRHSVPVRIGIMVQYSYLCTIMNDDMSRINRIGIFCSSSNNPEVSDRRISLSGGNVCLRAQRTLLLHVVGEHNALGTLPCALSYLRVTNGVCPQRPVGKGGRADRPAAGSIATDLRHGT